MSQRILVLGSFVADVAFRAARLPAWGETLMGSGFALGPGGKGSNQAVAAARALGGSHGQVQLLSRLGDDAFGAMARALWTAEGIDASLVSTGPTATGAAAILIDEARGENAILVVPGACFTMAVREVEAAAADIQSAGVFLAQLELPRDVVQRGLEVARAAGVPTILNPAPALPLPDSILALVDYLVPNETEAAALTGLPVLDLAQIEQAGRNLLDRGARNVILTLGERGAMLFAEGVDRPMLVPAFAVGPVLETTGAGDAFCGGFAAALLQSMPLIDAVRFGCATAGISVTRAGTAPSMPHREEIDALLKQGIPVK